jgi:membrane peptidoglycan carboxypeptidase
MSHEALGKTNKGKATNPNVWFVGVTPRRNPELVVAVLWQNGQFSYYPARIGAKVVSAYVEKQRRLANNLVTPAKPPAPAEMSAVWTVPPAPGKGKPGSDRLEAGTFKVDHGEIVGQGNPTAASGRAKDVPQGLKSASSLHPPSGTAKAVPFQTKDALKADAKAMPFQGQEPKQRHYVPDPQPAIASTGPGDGKGR